MGEGIGVAGNRSTNVVAGEVVDLRLGKHGVVFELRLLERRGVGRNLDNGQSLGEIKKSRELTMTSLALPDRRLLRVDLVPSVTAILLDCHVDKIHVDKSHPFRSSSRGQASS